MSKIFPCIFSINGYLSSICLLKINFRYMKAQRCLLSCESVCLPELKRFLMNEKPLLVPSIDLYLNKYI